MFYLCSENQLRGKHCAFVIAYAKIRFSHDASYMHPVASVFAVHILDS